MASPRASVLRTELRLFGREPGAIFWIVGFPAAIVAVLGLVPNLRDPIEGLGVSFIALYVNVAVLLAMIMAAVSAMPVVLATYREQRILRRFATTPAKPRDLLLAQYVIYGAAAVVGGALAVTIGRLAYGVALPQNPLGYVLVLLLMLAASLSLGGVVGGRARTAKIATAIGSVLIFPLMFTAGVWLPVAAMPGALGDVVAWTPLGAGAIALDATVAGGWPDVRELAVIVGWAAALSAAASRFFRWE